MTVPFCPTGRVVPAWLGIGIHDVTDAHKQQLGVPVGVMVTEVYRGGPAENTLIPGDVIVAFNGHKITDVSELSWLTSTAGIGNEVTLKVHRRGAVRELKVRVGEKPQMLR